MGGYVNIFLDRRYGEYVLIKDQTIWYDILLVYNTQKVLANIVISQPTIYNI